VATTPEFAVGHYQWRAELAEATAQVAAQAWSQVETAAIAQSWALLVQPLSFVVAGAQYAAAQAADAYVDTAAAYGGMSALAEGAVSAAALAGIASDGRDLVSLLFQAAISALGALRIGVDERMAMATGLATLEMITRTQVADAGRVADQVALTARPGLDGYVRMVVGKTCSRCVVLAGRWYRWNAGFDRHPRCDCIHIPAQESDSDDLSVDPMAFFRSLSKKEQDQVFTKAGAEAIRDGADIFRVVNARRGAVGLTPAGGGRRTLEERAAARFGRERGRLTRTNVFGRQHFTTFEAITLPGIRKRRIRLMPESIYELANGNRGEAIRLLKAHGYIL